MHKHSEPDDEDDEDDEDGSLCHSSISAYYQHYWDIGDYSQ